MNSEDKTRPSKPKPKPKPEPEPEPEPKPKKIQITVVTTAGDVKDNYARERPFQVVFDRAIEVVGGQGNPDQFSLEFDNQPLTDLGRSIGDYADELNWGKKVELELVPAPEVV